jgi:DNA-binding CsgD family transcriptional regulator
MPIQPLSLDTSLVANAKLAPHIMKPMIDAARAGRDLVPVVSQLVQSMSFDSFVYALSISPRPNREAHLYAFTTLPLRWMHAYDARAFVEVDPRIPLALDNQGVQVWDQNTFRGRSAEVDAFLDAAAQYDICSGLCYTIPDVHARGLMFAFNSRIPVIDDVRLHVITRNLAELIAFGQYFNTWFVHSITNQTRPSPLHGATLSSRELEILRILARGLSTTDVAERCAITARTVHFHLSSLRAKLNAGNTHEAIAIAYKRGFIDVIEN